MTQQTLPRPGGSAARGLAGRAAPVVFVLLWSTGFIGARYGLPYAPPFLFLALRLACAAVLLGLAAALTRSPAPPTRAAAGNAALVGLGLHGAYLGGVFWAISDGVPAGVTAVVVSLQPVLVAVLAVRFLGERLTALQWSGFAAGLFGVVLVLAPGLAAASSSPLPRAGLAACLLALAGGTFGTLHQKKHGAGIPLLSGTAVQYAAAAAVLAALALATEDLTVELTLTLVLAFVWLVLALSLGAVLLLFVLLRKGTASSVSTLLYLVPPVVAVEALVAFDERLAPVSVAGLVLTCVGVALVLRPRR